MENNQIDLISGETVQFDSFTDLYSFEDIVAAQVEPEQTDDMKESWMGRMPLNEFLRPDKFNGRLLNLALTVMADPFDRLADARMRGFTFHPKAMLSQLTKDKEVIDSMLGFIFSADAHSTGHGKIGTVHSEVWYSKISRIHVKSATETGERIQKNVSVYGGMGVKRYIAKPKIEKLDFIAFNQRSRKIGYAVLRTNMRHPYIMPIRN